jgi:hypothetical protein
LHLAGDKSPCNNRRSLSTTIAMNPAPGICNRNSIVSSSQVRRSKAACAFSVTEACVSGSA